MKNSVLFELKQSRERFQYYSQLKEKGSSPSLVVDKWIEIYSERTLKLETQVEKLGLNK